MRLLVCGDREWPESLRSYMYAVLDAFHANNNVTMLIEGEQRGADLMARAWAESRGIPVDPYRAEWEKYRPKPGVRRKNPAGAIRNREMARKGHPEYVLAFHVNPSLSKGSADMVSVAARLGIPYMWLPSEEYPMTNKPASPTTGQPGPMQPDRNAIPDPQDAVTRATSRTPPPAGTAPGIGGVPTPEEVVDLDHAPQITDIDEP